MKNDKTVHDLRLSETRSVGVIGLGSVGKALLHVLSFYHKCVGYDIKREYSWSDILRSNCVFVCVQTPQGVDRRLDCGHVTAVLERLAKDRFSGVVVIKSTVRVGYMDDASKKFPELRLVYSPEFLRERSSLQWTVNPDRIVLAGSKRDVEIVSKLFEWVEEAVTIQSDFLSAEIGKLAHNAFIATKVSFTNEIERVSLRNGADPRIVMEIVTADRRIKSKEHFRPYLGPYNGKCVPKDTAELISAGGDSAHLLKVVEQVNEMAKQKGLAKSEIQSINRGVVPEA